jgi:hypothetical protein
MSVPTTPSVNSTPASGWRQAAPIVTLLLLSPVIAEVLFGSTRITTLFVLVPQIGAWGCAALLIRAVVRRRRGSWLSILLLGVALAVAEECVIQQTSLAPLVGVDPQHVYGRAGGVNWVYLLWALGYESIWAVVLPIQFTELLFPARRDEPWLGRRGLIIAGAVFLPASFVAWYSWTQVFVPQYFPESAHQVSPAWMAVALAAIVGLVIAALRLPPSRRPEQEGKRPAPRPWQVGLAAFLLALPWFGLVLLAYGALPALHPAFPLAAGIVLAGGSFLLIERWSARPAWHDTHRLALVFGALLAGMLAGSVVLKVGHAVPIDRIGQLTFSVIAVLLLIPFARVVRRRPRRT